MWTCLFWSPKHSKAVLQMFSCWSLQTWCLKRVCIQDPKKYLKEKCGMVDTHRSLAPTCTSKEAPAAPFSLSLAKMPAGLVGATAGSSWSNPLAIRHWAHSLLHWSSHFTSGHEPSMTINDLHIQLGNLGISHTERDRMHGHEPDGTWHPNIWSHSLLKKLGPGDRLQSETTKAERNHRDFGCYFGPFLAPSSPSGWHGAKEFWRLDPVTHSPGWTQSPITGRCTCQESLWLQSNGSLKINGLILVWKGWYVQFPRSDSHHTARRVQLFHSQHNRMVHQIHQMPWHVW